MTKKEIAEALGIDKKEVIKDALIALAVLVLIFSVLLLIRHRMNRYIEVEKPIFLEKKVVSYVEEDTAYIVLTFLDNLDTSKHIKEIRFNCGEKEYVGTYEEDSYALSSVPRMYGGSKYFYKSELYQKPYSIRRQTIMVKGINVDMKADEITIKYSNSYEDKCPLDMTFTDNKDKREIQIIDEFIEKAEPLEGVQLLMARSEWVKSDAGEYKLNREGITNFLKDKYK